MVQIKGIDVSWHNGSVDWAKVKADGVLILFLLRRHKELDMHK
jgi:GH25 family lysozyme M1 (1,4-beta-N-acetylmuramidase)